MRDLYHNSMYRPRYYTDNHHYGNHHGNHHGYYDYNGYDQPHRGHRHHRGYSDHYDYSNNPGYSARRGRFTQSPMKKPPGNHLWERWLCGSPAHEPSPADLELLHDPKAKPARDFHKLAPCEALKLLLSSNLTPDEHHQGKRLYQKHEVDIESLPFKVFNDMDACLFHGVLRGNIYLCWSKDLPDNLPSRMTRPGVGSSPRIMIELSRKTSTHGSFYDVLVALAHQMVHAYLLQCWGIHQEDPDLHHGSVFNAATQFIQREIIGSHASSEPWKHGCHQEHNPRSAHNARQDHHRPMEGRTYCSEWGKGSKKKSIEKATKIAERLTSIPELGLRKNVPFDKDNVPRPKSQYFATLDEKGKPTEWTLKTQVKYPYVELSYSDYAVPFAHKDLSGVLGMTRPAVFSKDKAIITLPPATTWDTYCHLTSYMKNGRYAFPYCSDCKDSRDHHGSGKGTPAILDYKATKEPSLLLTDIKAYRLATAIQYPQMQSYALDRLYAMKEMHDDPIEALEMVYYGGPESKSSDTVPKSKAVKGPEEKTQSLPNPDSALCGWVRDWLRKPRPNEKYKTNLQLLEEHPDWRDKFVALTMRGGELNKDHGVLRIERTTEAENGEKERRRKIDEANRTMELQRLGYPLEGTLAPREVKRRQQMQDRLQLIHHQHQQIQPQLSPAQLQQRLELQAHQDYHQKYDHPPIPRLPLLHTPSSSALSYASSSTPPFVPHAPTPPPTPALTTTTMVTDPFSAYVKDFGYVPRRVYPNQHYQDPAFHDPGTSSTTTSTGSMGEDFRTGMREMGMRTYSPGKVARWPEGREARWYGGEWHVMK